ncbi:MAG TPA: metallopeptidase TldD-related protein [Jatrophihabitantaceae bacterium]|nr:metallopeptidase TldD-related protein [Jatrophihabitantaceae bacterium]
MIPMQDLVERVLSHSTADGCVVVGSEHTETNLRWAANNLTTNGQMASRSVTVISILDEAAGPSAGVVTRSVTSADEVIDLVAASEQAARRAGPADDAAPLVEPYDTDDDWSADPARTSVAVFERFADGLGAAFAGVSRRDRLLFGFAEHALTSTFVASSTGLRRRFDQPTGRVELNAKSADYHRSAWDGVHTRDFTDVDIGALTDRLNTRLDWAATTHDLPPGRYETILPPTAVADLMLDAYWTASARDAEEGRNVYARRDGQTRIGERLSELPLTLRSDPDEPGLSCVPFEVATASAAGLQSVFDNGAPVAACSWISNGELTELIRTRSWAARTSAPPRLLVDNLILNGDGTASLDDMIASTERGLLLTSLWYIREVDPQTLLLTGLTRDGVYLVENGAVRGAVNNFRFNESPVALLGRITEVGRTVPTLPREWADWFTRAAMPPVRVPDFNMSTVSQAS